MLQRGEWAESIFEEIKNDPQYVASKLMVEINEAFCKRMKETNVSRTELAARIGKTQPYVSKLLNHGTNMTLMTIAKIAEALELDVKPPAFVPKESRHYEVTVKNQPSHGCSAAMARQAEVFDFSKYFLECDDDQKILIEYA